MKRKRYSVEQIVAAVRKHDLGVSAADIARTLGIAEQPEPVAFTQAQTACNQRYSNGKLCSRLLVRSTIERMLERALVLAS